MSSKLLGAAAVGVLATLAVAYLAVGAGRPANSRDFKANLQQVVWNAEGDSTTSQEWEPIAGLIGSFCANTPVSATVSLSLEGGPGEFRVFRHHASHRKGSMPRVALNPGPVPVTPSSGSPVAFTFVDPARRSRFLIYHVEWRSTTGAEIRLDRGTVAFAFAANRRHGCLD